MYPSLIGLFNVISSSIVYSSLFVATPPFKLYLILYFIVLNLGVKIISLVTNVSESTLLLS